MKHSLTWLFLIALCLPCAGARAERIADAQTTPAKVMVVGTFHFANPGADMFNVRVDDVLSEKRQAEIARLVEGLARFEPNAVMVEAPAAMARDGYAKFRAGELPPTPNERVQLGYRLAAARGLGVVHGIDVAGEFPFAPVKAYADANGLSERLDGAMARVGQMIAQTNAWLETESLGQLLRRWNAPGRELESHRFYVDLLRYGSDEQQPGVALLSGWYTRNLAICARLLQALPEGGRAVVIYGDGHAHLLRQCVIEAPGVELVEAVDYLVE